MSEAPAFDAKFHRSFCDLLAWRRDVRRFRTNSPPEGTLERLFALASLAPSVGLSQPWRFVVVDNRERRAAIRADFERCNQEALSDYSGARARLYATLKLAGLDAAPIQFGVFADRDATQGHGLGRRTMPETTEYSAVMAVHTLWLAARVEGLGLGWISILDPSRVAEILEIPSTWRFIGYFCLGYPEQTDHTPALERAGWEERRSSAEFILRR
ncbi:MAG TPA: 5,6-dimethylbenzimidazole synthase [Alphaproteobacteria bacterium]|nr:5,6-dimethylbenzimidazole synthase [Alphaproteobacteria bacterium]